METLLTILFVITLANTLNSIIFEFAVYFGKGARVTDGKFYSLAASLFNVISFLYQVYWWSVYFKLVPAITL